jgi:ADP-ribosylglycohydrolase
MGGLVGLVVGDALGVPVEFSTRAERDRDPVAGLRGFGMHGQPPGAWSDDGALALAHAAAFAAHGWDPARHLDAFLAWERQASFSSHDRVFDIGRTTREALRRWAAGAAAAEAGGRGERDNGNGSLMRILPVSCWWAAAPDLAVIARLGEASALTHAHERSRLVCALHGLLTARLLSGRPLRVALAAAIRAWLPAVPAAQHAGLEPLRSPAFLDWSRERIPSDGHVVSTLVAACWCLDRHEDFAGAVLAAVNLGGDTDTTAAVVGGLAGLRCGLSGLPRPWLTCLPRSGAVHAAAEAFADACLGHDGR